MPNAENPLPNQIGITDEPTHTTLDEAVKNTEAKAAGAGTQPDPKTEAQTEKTFTQADIDRIVQDRLKSAGKSLLKAELKKLFGDDAPASVEDLQQQLSDTQKRAQSLEARESVRDYLNDPTNKLNLRSENIRAIEKLVMDEIQYSDDGKPSNVKEAVNAVKNLAPTLFINSPSSINAGQGRNGHNPINDMNQFIRDAHARRG